MKKISHDLPDIVILCGGEGTRLHSVVSHVPKSLAGIGDRVFLDVLLQMIFDQGFTRVILAVGHMKEKIIEKYRGDPRISFSVEEAPLGTGGAVMNALGLVRTEHFIVMNGDSYCDVNLKKVHKEHKNKKALVSIVLAKLDDVSDSGSVLIDEDGRIRAFEEKVSKKGAGLVNAGIYIFDKKIQNFMPPRNNFSLEYDLFPAILEQLCYGYVVPGEVLDIGTPEKYDSAKKKLTNL